MSRRPARMRPGTWSAPLLSWLLALLTLSLGLAAAAPALAQATPPAVSRLLPIERHPNFPNRIAVVIAPSPALNVRAGHAANEAERAVQRLREYGFEVLSLGLSTRPELVSSVRDISRQLQQSPNAEVAVLIYGELIKFGDDIFIAPNDLTDSARRQPASLEINAMRLSVMLRWISEAQPRRLVVVADACTGPLASGSCLAGLEAQLAGRAIIASHRRASTSPLGAGSLHGPLMTVTTTPGLPFSALPDRLRTNSGTTQIDIVATSPLPGDFSFLPANYLETLPHGCNRVADILAQPDGPESAVWPHIEACERAVTVWNYAPHFQSNLGRLRELQAYRRAVASCESMAAIEAYIRDYPNGAYIQRVRAHQERCKPAQRVEPPIVQPPVVPPIVPPKAEPRQPRQPDASEQERRRRQAEERRRREEEQRRPERQPPPDRTPPRPAVQDCKTPATARGDPRCSISMICRRNLARRGVTPNSMQYIPDFNECQSRLRRDCPWCPG